MKHLDKNLELWRSEGLLTIEQADAIRQFESRPGGRSWVVFGIASVGVVALCTGFISVIAANWNEITSGVKLFMYYAVLLGAAGFLWRKLDSASVVRELLTVFLMIWILAGIGLVGQIYQLESESWHAFAFWLVLTLSLVQTCL